MTPRREAAIDISSIDSQLRAIERNEGTGTLEIDSGVSLRVSSLSKPFSHKIGVTKAALMRYYTRIWPVLQPHVQDRALVIEALPRRRWRSNVLSAERWSKGAERSPGPFSEVVSLARDVRNIIGQCGLSAAVKTSGSSGIHLVIPLPSHVSFEKSARLALQISRVAVQQQPTRATMERSIKARPTGTIYVDALQNARGKSMAGAYSVRARAEATVSAPIRERELSARLRTASFTVSTMPPRVARLGDLWDDGLSSVPSSRTLTTAIAVLERVLDDKADDAPPATKSAREKRGSSKGGSDARATGSRRSRRG